MTHQYEALEKRDEHVISSCQNPLRGKEWFSLPRGGVLFIIKACRNAGRPEVRSYRQKIGIFYQQKVSHLYFFFMTEFFCHSLPIRLKYHRS